MTHHIFDLDKQYNRERVVKEQDALQAEIATLRAQLTEAKKYPELRCNHCDKVLTATWIDDALGRFALIDKCYCG